jgi:MscS family membrane protein
MDQVQNFFTGIVRYLFPVSSTEAHEVSGSVIALGCIVIAFVLQTPITWIVMAWLRGLAKKFPNDWLDAVMVESLRAPIRMTPLWIGLAAANEMIKFPPRQEAFADHVVLSLGAALFFWALIRAIQPLSRHLSRLEGTLTRPMINWMISGLTILVLIIAVASVLSIWGIQIGGILAGLGIFGAAVALGAQDLFKNLIAGILILTEKRFDIGDWILQNNVIEGEVERIGFRSTLVRRFDKAPVYIPNSKLSDDAITNFSRLTSRGIQWTVSVNSNTPKERIDEACAEILNYIRGNKDFIVGDNTPLFVGMDQFSSNGLDIQIRSFTSKTRWAEYGKVKAELAVAVKEALERQKIGVGGANMGLTPPGS